MTAVPDVRGWKGREFSWESGQMVAYGGPLFQLKQAGKARGTIGSGVQRSGIDEE